jgi:dihydropyrimidinase
MAYKNSIGLDDDALFKVMSVVGKAGGLVTIHCEDGDEIEKLRTKYFDESLPGPEAHVKSRPPELEAKAVAKAIMLAAKAKCPIYIVHVSSAESLQLIRKAQQAGQVVYAETCPQYLFLDRSKYQAEFEESLAFVMSPPLRNVQDNFALWQGLADGAVSTVGTDHCPFLLSQKMLGKDDFRKIPNGAGGVEHRMALLYTYGVLENKIDLKRFVDLTSTNAAKIFGLYPQKGVIAEGSDADLVIWNPETESIISVNTHHQNCDLNIYEGIKTKGSHEVIILGGNVVKG